MSWIILASIPPFLWAISNHVDEYLSKHHFTTSPFLMIIGACLVQFPIGIALLAYHPEAFSYSLITITILCVVGALVMLCFVPYIKALQIDGASVAVPIYQIIPVFTFSIAWFFLDEIVSAFQLSAAFLIIMAAFAITWDFDKKSISYKTVYLMFISSFGLALYNVFSRYYLTNGVDWISMLGWSLIGMGVFGVLAIIAMKSWRRDLYNIVSTGGLHVSGLFIFQALLDLTSFGLFIAATAIAPAVGFVSTLNGLQPFYVLIISAMAGYFLPQHFQKSATGKTLLLRISCIVILFIGVAILSLSA